MKTNLIKDDDKFTICDQIYNLDSLWKVDING